MTGDRIVKSGFAGFGGLIVTSIGLAAIVWVLDSILDSIIFHEGTLIGQILSPTVREIGIRVLFGFVLIVFGIYTQLNTGRRTHLEGKVRQSEEKYRMLVENIQEGVFIIQDAKFQFVNEAFARTAGYNVGEVIGRDFKDFVAPEDLKMVADRYYRRQAGESVPDEYEFRMMCKDGAKIVVNMNVGLVTYRGRVASMGILKDITERKRAQEALRKSEEKFRDIFEQSPIAIELYDKTGKLIDANRSCLDLFGVNNVESVIGFKLFDDPNITEDTKTRLSNGENVEFESVFDFALVKKARLYETTKSGKCYLDILIVPLTTEERENYGYLVHVRDITKRKEAEEALHESEEALQEAVVKAEEERNKSNAIIAALGDGIIIQDTDYKIVYQNQVQNDLFGNHIGEYCYKVYEGRDSICEWCPVEKTFRDGKIHRTEREINTGNGLSYYELVSSPLKNSEGKIIAGVKVVRNITGLKRTEQELRERERFLADIFASIQDGIGIIDKDMNILRVNTTAEKWYPHTKSFIGRKCYEAYHGRNERCEVCPAWETLKTGESAYATVPKHGPGGKKAGWLEIYSFPLTDTADGEMKGVIEYVRDITERKRTEEALAESENKFRTLFDNAIDGILLADIETRKFYLANKKMCEMLGYSPEEIKTLAVEDIHPEKELAWILKVFEKQVTGGCTLASDIPIKRKDGTVFYADINTSPVNIAGKAYSIGIFRDITERKNVEEKLKLLSGAVEEAPDGVQIVDLNGFIIYSNRAVEEIYGFSPDELKGKHVNEMNADPEFAVREILPNLKTKGRWEGELIAKKKNGQEIPIWLTTSIVKDSIGKPIAMVGVIKDMTERKRIEHVLLESEERYRSLFENSPISLWEEDCSDIKKYIDALKSKGIRNLRAYFDKHQEEVSLCTSMVKVVDVNKATINLFKAKSKGDLIDGLEKIFTESSYEVFKEELIAISEGKTSFESEDIVKTLTGDKIHISMRWGLTPGSEKTYSKRLVSVIDITERKRIEEEIKKYTRELEESNRMKELFTDIMHHDLLNPLTTANGFIELLKENETISRKKTYLETVERSLAKGMGLIDSAMKFSRFESLKSIELEEMDLKKIIEEVIEALTPMADNAGIELINRITLNTPVRANKIIEEVFSNLISNAIKYASSGKRIIIESENKGKSLQVRIIDFGEGIKESDKTMIFERFRRGGKTGVKGSGLGLAIAGKIMELHNGRIWVEDNPEGGSIFIVELPI